MINKIYHILHIQHNQAKINKMMNLLKIEKLTTNTNRVETFNNKMIEKEVIIIIKKTIIRIENIIRRIKIKSTMNPKIHNINKLIEYI